MDDKHAAELVRESLRLRAADAKVAPGLGSTVRARARRRQRVKVVAAGAAAAAVVVPVGVLAARGPQSITPVDVAGPGATSGGATTLTTSSATSDPGGVLANWRVESYGGVQLRVPPDWGWGGVPLEDFGQGNDLMMCGTGAFASPRPAGQTLLKAEVDMPYVGRGGYYMSDMCVRGLPAPTQPYVWLGSPVELGTVDLDNGFAQRTVESGGVRVTVGDDSPAELQAILGTLEAVDVDANGCETAAELDPPPGALSRLEHADSVSVCVYHRAHGGPLLGYSTEISGSAAEQLLAALKETPGALVLDCGPGMPGLDKVLLRFHGAGATTDVVVDLDRCGGYGTAEGIRRFTAANVEPWLVDGVKLYASGGQIGNELSRLPFFR